MKLKMTLAVALLTMGLSSAAAHADSVTFTLTNPQQYASGSLGGTVTYDATVTDNTGAVQTADQVGSVPDGATGWHTVDFSVA